MTLDKGARISREDFYMQMAHVLAKRSTCLRGQVGCVLVRDNHIIGGGYNGSPPGMPHCLDVGCGGGVGNTGLPVTMTHEDPVNFPNGCTRAIHAELNAVAFSARHGVRTGSAALYCTHGMCRACAQAVVSAGIIVVVYETPYRDESGIELLKEAGVIVMQYDS